MSSGQEGDVPSKGNKTEGDLLVTCVDEPIPKMKTEDQTDHAIGLTPKKLDQLEDPDSATSKTDTDSGFKDPGTDPKATTVVNADSSGDEDMHLKWEDDEADDLGVTSGDIPEKSITKYGTEEIKVEELEESLDENLLLESSDEMDKTDDTSNKDEGTANEDEIDKLLVSDDNKQAIETLNTNNDSEKTDLIGVSVQPDLLSKNNEETIKNLQMSIAESTQEKSVVSINDITLLDAKDESIIDDAIVTASSPNESLSNTTIDAKLDHKLNNPDVMLEIPTQEIIDLMDDTDMSLSCTNDDDDMEKTVDDVAESPKAMDVSDEPEETIQSADSKTDDISTVLDSEVSKVDTMIGENKEPCGDLASVSEDDWTQIENRLAKFETSLVDESKEDIESNDEKNSKYISSTEKSSTVNDDSANMDGAISTLASQNIDEQSPNPKSTNVGTTIEPHSNTESKALEKSTTEISAETENTPESPKPSQEALTTDVEVSETKLEQSQPLKDLSAIEGIGDTTTNSDKTEIATNITESKGEIKKNMPTNEDTFPPKEEIISTPSTSQITELPITVTSPEDTKNNDTSLSESCKEIDDHPSKDTTNEPIKESLSMDVDNVIQSHENANKVQLLDETSSEGNVTAKPTTLVESDKKSLKGTTAPDSELVPDIIKTVNNIEDTTPLQPTKLETLTASKEVTIDNSTLNVQLSETVIDVDSIPDSQDMADDLLAKIISSDQIKVMPKSLEEKNNSTIETTEDGLKQDTARVVNADEIITSTEMLKEILEQSKLTSRSGPSHQASDSSDEVAEITDSLGLLAESSRVMEDDEEQEDDEDDDDDFYHEDESSNQMTAEHSEDSNQQTSETEVQKEQEEKEMETESPTDEKEQGKFSFDVDENIKVEDGETERIFKVDIDTTEIVLAETKEEVKITVKKGITPVEEVKSEQRLQEVKTVKLSDASETDASAPSAASDTPSDGSTLKKLLCDAKAETVTIPAKPSPILKLALAKQDKVLNFVDLEESSEDDEVLVVKKIVKLADATEGTLADGEGPSEAPPAHNKDKTTQLSEVIAAETTTHNDSPSTSKTPGSENKFAEETKKPKQKFGLEIFNLDSDEEDSAIQPEKPAEVGEVVTPAEVEEPQKADKARAQNRCINVHCTGESETYSAPDAAAVTYYDAAKKRRAMVCERCALVVADRTRTLIEGIKDLTPLLSLEIGKVSSEVVEISDSDPEDEVEDSGVPEERVGESGAKFLEAELAKAINETWMKFKMDSRLTDAEDALNKEMKMLEEQTKEIDAMLDECQAATDQLRNELYATFEQERHELNSLVIFDTPTNKYTCLESAMQQKENTSSPPGTRSKRRMSSATESASKRPAIPLGYAPLDADKNTLNQDVKSEPTVETLKTDDDKELTVLKVSVEAPPADLPPLGELARPPLRADAYVFVMRNTFGSWARGKILEVQGKGVFAGTNQNFTICRVKVFSRNQCKTKLVPARCLAYNEPAEVRLTIGTRVIAVFIDPMNLIKRETYYSGIVAEMPNPVNGYRYLVFFDDGYAQYVRHKDTRLVCECSPLVWEEVHPFSREFVRKYLIAYPERPMVRLHAGQSLKTEWNGKWWPSRVIQVDASLVHVHFEEDDRTEWIYRGSTRLAPLYLELQAAERQRTRPMPRTKAQARVNMPYVEYTRSDEQSKSEPAPPPVITAHEREIRQRAVAKKSTTAPPPADTAPAADPAPASDGVSSRVVYYTPKTAIKPLKMVQHSCGPKCKRSDTYSLKELRTYNPLAKPLLSGWERQIVRYNGHKEVMYRAPCGRRLRNIWELHRYLRAVHSEMAVDLFDFTPHTHCLAEFVLNKCLVGKKDLSYGKENVPVPCVNYYDESMPEFCSYNTERTPTAGVPLNLDPEFLCGCDCTDDCEDKSKCACWKMTLEGARTIGLRGKNIGYVYKRLPEPLPSGIYECNSRCKCKKTCLNRVAQHPLQLKLQVFKTLNRGWGIRALNDVPKGSFLCVYAGNLLTDATANMDGLNEGDEYLAELDYIEVVEQMKEGYEEDIPEADKRLDKVTNEEPESSSEEEEPPSKDEKEDDDFYPGHIGMGVAEFSKRLRKRDKNKKEKEEADVKVKTEVKKEGEKTEEDCITISDDEEVREPSRFMAQAGMESSEFISKHRSVRSYFGKDEACYIMDAKVQGNIGRYLNHSCMPNVFVQNVFVDTHDPRFPWVAFFALSHIKAGTELTWNYNYDVGSVPGKSLYCYCGAPNCRGRLL